MLAQQHRTPTTTKRRPRPVVSATVSADVVTPDHAHLLELERLRAIRAEAQAWVRSLEARIGALEGRLSPEPSDAA